MEKQPESVKVPLTVAERKHQLERGSIAAIAEVLGIDRSYVTKVVAGEVFPKTAKGRATLRRARAAVARKLGVSVAIAFPESAPQTNQDAAPLQAAS